MSRTKRACTRHAFPGLDLPFGNMVNDARAERSACRELMAIDFAARSFLYLDTHAGDAEAFAAYQICSNSPRKARSAMQSLYGPITKRDLLNAETYTWLKKSPWGIPRWRHGGLTHVCL